MNAKMAKLIRRKARECGWDKETTTKITRAAKELNAEGRALLRRTLARLTPAVEGV